MTRGNQREQARQRNQKKQDKHSKGKSEDGVSLVKRRENDAEIMRQKQLKAKEKEAANK
ncbi:small edrk-rich factor 2 [Coemansia reversa NRRL 1564]|uniref:Small edrk-rich factor 2 n=1 Tax=Coemansia reversa (strain ATCC 12441 / NRRL 1564) TaxID=763665 RepID=A0A2G5BBE0_COERN|nr:small edrk-rich factor 2 [Coemansia reversa NRRL 1564]|eukprot:PIA16320.1 small edrk-rich factor 2 [Coemansia reversa NRRL 1564]